MKQIVPQGGTLLAVLALGALLGCQGVSVGGNSSKSSNSQGTLPGQITASPANISFGNVQVGGSQTQPDTLSNTGGSSITVSQVTVTGTGFSTSGLTLPLTLAAGQSAAFNVVFQPMAAGGASGTLAITSSGSGNLVSVALTATGVAAGSLSASASSVNFGSVTVGGTQSQSETLTNTGGENLTISSATASGTGFSYAGLNLPITLAPNQATTFSVSFAPQASGSYSGAVAIASSGSNANLSISLSGLATTQAGQLSASAVSVGNVTDGSSGTQTGTLTATGASVAVSSVNMGGTNPAEFSISGITFPVTVSTAQPVNFTVTFTPQASGGASASAAFASNASNSPAAASLTGTGVAATAHSVNLTWDASSSQDVVSYNIYRASFNSACGAYAKVGSSASTTYTDSAVTNGQAYCYEATAVDSSGDESKDSSPVQNVVVPSS
jgi:hypothetical protein